MNIKSLSARRTSVHPIYRLTAFSMACLFLVLAVVAPYASAQETSEELLAQKTFMTPIVDGMALTKTSAGAPLAVTMPGSINALLEVINLNTMQRVLLQEQAHDGKEVTASAYVTLPNRHVLIGTTGGVMYDLNPDKLTVAEQVPEDVVRAAIYAAVLGEGSDVYVASADTTGTHILAYNYAKTTWREVTTLPGAEMGLSYSEGNLYTGNAETLGLWRINPQTGTKDAVATTGTPNGVTSLKVQLVDGDLVYAVGYGGQQPRILVYSLSKGNLVEERSYVGDISKAFVQPAAVAAPQAPVVPTSPTATPAQTTPVEPQQTSSQTAEQSQTSTDTQAPPAQNQPAAAPTPAQPTTPVASAVYVGALIRYDAATKTVKAIAAESDMQPVAENCWIDANRCVVYGEQGKLGIVTLSARRLKLAVPSPIVGGAHAIGSITIGARDMVYVASAADDKSVLQLDRDKTELRRMIAQQQGAVTSMLSAGTGLMVGTASGRIAAYDPSTQDAVTTFQSGVVVGTGSVTALAVASDGQVAFGLRADSAKPSGSVGLYNALSRSVSTVPQVVLPDQSVKSMVYAGGVIYGGGAVDQSTPATGAALFAFDVASHAPARTIVPVAGAPAITSLTVGPNGHLYGTAGATLFEVDPQAMAVVRTKTFYETGTPGNVITVGDHLVASIAGKIYSIQPQGLNATYITSGTHVAVNSLGDYYFSRGGALYRLLAPRQNLATGVSMKPIRSAFDFSRIDLKVSLAALGTLTLLVVVMTARKRLHRHHTYSLRR